MKKSFVNQFESAKFVLVLFLTTRNYELINVLINITLPLLVVFGIRIGRIILL